MKVVKAAAALWRPPRQRLPPHEHYCNGDYVEELFGDECDDDDDCFDDYDDNCKLMIRPMGRIGDRQLVHQPEILFSIKGPFILLCRIISVECPTNFDPRFMLIGCLGLPLF